MASFPTTNITYANRSAGQAIASAHINSLQDEIAAIELGYLTGTARLNAAGSTVTSLSVTGGSTLNGLTLSTHAKPGSTTVSLGDSTTGFKEVHCSSLYVGGVAIGGANSTFTTPAVFSTIVTAAAQPRVMVRSSNLTGPTNESSAVSFNIEDTDVGGMHSTSVNPDTVTIPQTGVYYVTAQTWFGASGNAERVLRVKQNSTTIARASLGSASGTINGSLTAAAIVSLLANDAMTVTVDGGGAAIYFGSTSSPELQTKLSIARMW